MNLQNKNLNQCFLVFHTYNTDNIQFCRQFLQNFYKSIWFIAVPVYTISRTWTWPIDLRQKNILWSKFLIDCNCAIINRKVYDIFNLFSKSLTFKNPYISITEIIDLKSVPLHNSNQALQTCIVTVSIFLHDFYFTLDWIIKKKGLHFHQNV